MFRESKIIMMRILSHREHTLCPKSVSSPPRFYSEITLVPNSKKCLREPPAYKKGTFSYGFGTKYTNFQQKISSNTKCGMSQLGAW